MTETAGKRIRAIRYTCDVLYGTSTKVVRGTEVLNAEIYANGHAWWRKDGREYLVYPSEYEECHRVSRAASCPPIETEHD